MYVENEKHEKKKLIVVEIIIIVWIKFFQIRGRMNIQWFYSKVEWLRCYGKCSNEDFYFLLNILELHIQLLAVDAFSYQKRNSSSIGCIPFIPYLLYSHMSTAS